MAALTLTLPDELESTLSRRVADAGFERTEDYLLSLVKADCACAELDAVLEARSAGPFIPLPADWKEQARENSRARG